MKAVTRSIRPGWQRPAKAPGEDRNLTSSRRDLRGGQQRPAKAPGEDRNKLTRGSRPCARAAPGQSAGRGSQQHRQRRRTRTAPRSARPKRRARIATLQGRRAVCVTTSAAPGQSAGRGSQHAWLAHRLPAERAQRPAKAPGEDRNRRSARRSGRTALAAPGQSAGRGSQLGGCLGGGEGGLWCSARPKRRARIATRGLRSDGAGGSRQRPAKAPGEDRNPACGGSVKNPDIAAPGQSAGRGSQP